MFAPESRCAPATLPFSITATGTSPRLLGQLGLVLEQLHDLDRAGEAGRPTADDRHADLDPSSSGSVGSVTNSSAAFTGGGNSARRDRGIGSSRPSWP